MSGSEQAKSYSQCNFIRQTRTKLDKAYAAFLRGDPFVEYLPTKSRMLPAQYINHACGLAEQHAGMLARMGYLHLAQVAMHPSAKSTEARVYGRRNFESSVNLGSWENSR